MFDSIAPVALVKVDIIKWYFENSRSIFSTQSAFEQDVSKHNIDQCR